MVLDYSAGALCHLSGRADSLVSCPSQELAIIRSAAPGWQGARSAHTGSVLARGMEITSSADEADVLVVNTCAFIDSAKEESINAILEAHQQRGLAKNPGQKLIVSGCMSQRFSRELRESLPEVDAFVGLDEVSEMGAIVRG